LEHGGMPIVLDHDYESSESLRDAERSLRQSRGMSS
jgi:hypothetical protein